MESTNALSYKDYINTTGDNAHALIIPDPLVINALDLALT